MIYKELIDNIENRVGKFKSKGNIRMIKILEHFDNPCDSMKFIHIAGTNGKGSTSYFLYEILKSKFKVGLYTSPGLTSYRDRIVVGDLRISQSEFLSIGEEILEKEKLILDRYGELNKFEFLTTIAFIYFKRKNCQLVVLEVGMGGRCDSTNIIKAENKLISIITSISYDHMQYLGNTIEEISSEKAGIICQNGIVVTSNKDKKILKVLQDECKKKNASIYYSKDLCVKILKSDLQGSKFILNLEKKDYEISLDQIGLYQIENAILCLYSLFILIKKALIDFDFTKATKLIKDAKWKGRMDLVSKNPRILLDGAHNIGGIKKLRDNLKLFYFDKLYLVSSILKDKDHKKMLEEIGELADLLILVDLENKSNEDIEILEKEARASVKKVMSKSSLKEALNYIVPMARPDDLILVSGSLQLIKEFYILKEMDELSYD